MQDPPSLYLIRNFDIMKLDRACNIHGCNRLPNKEAIIIEVDINLKRQRELARLYFCNDHYDLNIRTLMKEMSRLCEMGKVIDKKVFDLLYVSH